MNRACCCVFRCWFLTCTPTLHSPPHYTHPQITLTPKLHSPPHYIGTSPDQTCSLLTGSQKTCTHTRAPLAGRIAWSDSGSTSADSWTVMTKRNISQRNLTLHNTNWICIYHYVKYCGSIFITERIYNKGFLSYKILVE